MSLQLLTRALSAAPESDVSRETARALGGALLGNCAAMTLPAWPVQRIFAPIFGSTAAVIEETWLTGLLPVSGRSEGIGWCCLLYTSDAADE